MKNIKVTKAINELVANGGSIAKAMRKAGYSPRTARTPKKMTDTQAFQVEVTPVVEQMEKERNRILKAMQTKELSEVQYQHLADVVDKFTKNIQLLGGKPTETNKLEISWE